jgi:hypothetical protein
MPQYMFFFIPLFVFLAVVGGLVYGAVFLARRRRGFAEVDPGIGTVRRLYYYGVSFVALMMAANGIVQIGIFVLEGVFGGQLLSPSRVQLATGLALIVVGLPLWGLHWRLISGHVRALPVERNSVLRKVYIYAVLGVAAVLALPGAVSILAFTFQTGSFRGYPWAALLVWGGVWAYHWWTERAEGQSTPETQTVRRLYLYAVSAAVLSASALGLGQIVHTVFREAYLSLTSQTVVNQAGSGLWTEPTRLALAMLLVTAPAWVAHFLLFARGDQESTLRQVYLYVFAAFGGVITVITATGIIAYWVLEWFIVVPSESAATHFRFLPGAATSLIVGGGILIYHFGVGRAESRYAAPERQAAQQSYPYVLAAVGLVMTAFAIGALVDTVIVVMEGIGSQILAGDDRWRDSLVLALTFGLLGTPIWAYYWAQIRRRVLMNSDEERNSQARRMYIFGILGVGMLALLGSLSFILFVFFREILDGSVSNIVGDARGAFDVLAPALVFVPYHWMLYREDRRLAPESEMLQLEASRRKAVTVLVGENAADFLESLEAALGYGVSPLRWADPEAIHPYLTPEEFQDLAYRIGDAEGANVLLVPDTDDVQVLSYH